MLLNGATAIAPTEPTCCYCGRGPRFSCLPISFFVLLALAVFSLCAFSWATALLTYLPAFSIFYFVYVKRLRPALLAGDAAPGFPHYLPHNLDDLFARMAASGYVPGTLLATMMGVLPNIIFLIICFGGSARGVSEKDAFAPGDDTSLSALPGWVPYTLLTSFVSMGFIGELSKYLLVTCGCCVACCAQVADPRPKEAALRTIALLLAVALGYACAEGFTLGMVAFATGALHDAVRLVLSAPLHCVAAAFTGLRLSVRGQQARQRDIDALSAGGGGEQLVMLASGATVRVVVAPSEGAPPTAAPEGGDADTAPLQQQAPPLPPRQVVLWGWARVIWPAAVISGAFHFVVCVLGRKSLPFRPRPRTAGCSPQITPRPSSPSCRLVVIDPVGGKAPSAGATAGAAILAALILAAASCALWLQFRAIFDVICSGGRIPERLTMAMVWWPERARVWWLLRAGAFEAGYDPSEEGYLPLRGGPPQTPHGASGRAPAWAAATGAPLPPPPPHSIGAPGWAGFSDESARPAGQM